MSIKNTDNSYGSIAIALHWIMAILVITMITVGFTMAGMSDGDEKWQIYAIHKATGLIVLTLALFRWYWMLSNPKPKALDNWTKAEIGIAHGSKWLLMIMIIIMPIAGITMSLAGGHDISFFGLFTIEALAEKNEELEHLFHEVHEIGAYVIGSIIGLHILAAAKHHFISKDNTLNRILGRNN